MARWRHSVSVSFVPPAGRRQPAAAGPGIPLLSLVPTVGTGGTLAGGQTLYYAVSGEDSAGNESPLSFIVRASIVERREQRDAIGVEFRAGNERVRRLSGNHAGGALSNRFRAAAGRPVHGYGARRSTDCPSRFEFRSRQLLLADGTATGERRDAALGDDGGKRIVADDREPLPSMIARITRGTGAGQERAIAANDATSLTIAPPWSVEPDATSFFVVAETGWQFGALTTSSPVQFAVPNRSGEVVHLTGRAANVNDVECAPEISTVTRWQIGGGGTGDSDVPPMPFFGLGPGQGGGTVELSGVSFTDLTNTRTISAATLTMYYWDELQGTPAIALASAVGTGDTVLSLSSAGSAQPGSFIQIELEVMRVEAVAEQRHTVHCDASHGWQPGGGTRRTNAGVSSSEPDGDRAVPAGVLRQPLQRELELPHYAAGCAGGQRRVVRHQPEGEQPDQGHLSDPYHRQRAAHAVGRAVLHPGGRVPGSGSIGGAGAGDGRVALGAGCVRGAGYGRRRRRSGSS